MNDGPCASWATGDNACRPLYADHDADEVDTKLMEATEVYWGLSGRVFGLCPLTVRPCTRHCLTSYVPGLGSAGALPPFVPLNLGGGAWTNVSCCSGDGCSHTSVDVVELPGPVHSVEEVKVDGAVLDPTGYLLYEGRLLYRTGGARWPTTQDLSKLDTEAGTWSVTFTKGRVVPAIGVSAVVELAGELLKACAGDKSCRLPMRVQNVTRQGVSMQLITAGDLRGTGLRMGELFLDTYNPERLAQPSGVYSVDYEPPRRQTTWS